MAKRIGASQSVDRRPASGKSLVPDRLRTCLAEVDNLVRAASPGLVDTFRPCQEQALARGIARRCDDIAAGRYGWSIGPDSDGGPKAWVLAAIQQVRALDDALALMGDTGSGPVESCRQWCVPEHGVYVVPRRAGRSEGTKPKAGQPYSRRGPLHHSILPMRLGDMQVKLARSAASATAGPVASPPVMGAALFSDYEITYREVAGPSESPRMFLVERFETEGSERLVDRQVASAFADGCFAVVWPELTVAPSTRERIGQSLACEALARGKGRPFQVAVAGSWHVEGEGGWRNEAAVLDRHGNPLLVHDKIKPFFDEEHGLEAIERGIALSVVVTEDLLVGVATCLDFCDSAAENPYFALPIDVLLVPSMGGDSTSDGHLANAKALRLRNAATAFIVQQALRPSEDGLGDVLYCTSGKPAMARQTVTWKTYDGKKSQTGLPTTE